MATKESRMILPLHGHASHDGLESNVPFSSTSLSSRVRNEAIAFTAELVGTFMFLFFAFGATHVANITASEQRSDGTVLSQAPTAATLQYIALAFGFSLAANVWTFFRISGGLFNPVVNLALYLVGAIKGVRATLCFVAQIIGGIAAAAAVNGLLPGPLSVATGLSEGTSTVQGLFLEMFLTAELVLAILFLAAEKHKATFLAPIGIGLALFVAELVGVYFTGGSLNPARSLGPAVITRDFPHYHWIYWLGPILGSLLAVGFYKLCKSAEYETVNPGQDFNEREAELFKSFSDASTVKPETARPNNMEATPDDAVHDGSWSPLKTRGRGSVATRSSRQSIGNTTIKANGRIDRGVESTAGKDTQRKHGSDAEMV